MDKLNEKLLKFAGFEYRECNPNHPQLKDSPYGMGWFHPSSTTSFHTAPNFPESLDLCFKWLVPKLDGWIAFTGEGGVHFIASKNGLNYEIVAETPALALCLAIEKLIGGETNG